MIKDWTGNSKSIFTCNGASNHSKDERQEHDYYATEPKAVELLLQKEQFSPVVWECACGEGHICEVLKAHGYKVKASDLYDRGYAGTEVVDFLTVASGGQCDIITNPPYKFAQRFVEHALDISEDGTKVAMFLKLTFLESKARAKMFEKYPPQNCICFFSQIAMCKKRRF